MLLFFKFDKFTDFWYNIFRDKKENEIWHNIVGSVDYF